MTEQREERHALCPDCGQGFSVYLDRITQQMPDGHDPHADYECPHCGCRECKLQDSVR